MDAAQTLLAKSLIVTLEEMVEFYYQLLAVVGKEHDLLIAADRSGLEENNSHKEILMAKVQLIDQVRMKRAGELGSSLGLTREVPRLLELAQQVSSQEIAEQFQNLHRELNGLIKKISDLNKENEVYAQSAMKTLSGALDEIKGTLSGKKTYERKGHYKLGPETTGNFVSKEA